MLKYQYRITKYDPKNRDDQGRYTKDEWIDFGDIGYEFEGKELTLGEYAQIESKYIKAVIFFMECLETDTLQINGLETYTRPGSGELKKVFNQIRNKMVIKKDLVPDVIRLILRNYIWCLLVKENQLHIDYAGNFYIFLASKKKCTNTIKRITNLGLFVEEIIFFDSEEEIIIPKKI